jgi:hypothetical protein
MVYQINQNIILTGDLNSDLFTSHNNKLIDTINLSNLTNVIEKPTRVTEHSSTLLDPIIISDFIHYSFSDILKVPSDISDHDASIILIECPKFQTRSFQREVWLYERTDNEKIASKLDTVDWNALLSDSQMYRIAYYNRVKQRTAVFCNSRGLFNNIRQIKQIHCVNQFIVMRSK